MHFTAGVADRAVFADVKPTLVMMNGLLHHLDDAECIGLLEMCAGSDGVKRIVTNDTVYLQGKHLNNAIARLDRGRHVRHLEGYRTLVGRTSLTIERFDVVRSHPTRGVVEYLVMVLTPQASAGPT